jgi:BirA family biotin operon repressor/biotin-[acetyl-CoA-carboxylase] ligase
MPPGRDAGASHHLQADPLTAARIRSFLPEALTAWPIEVHRVLGSTNDRARDLMRAGAAPGLCVIAEEQTAGRGSSGRRWVSRPGAGLWMSVLLKPGEVPPGIVTLGAGVAVVLGIGQTAAVPLSVQWPNDVMSGQQKVCGILAEALPGGAVVLGIGINVHGAPRTEEIGRAAICLDLLAGRAVDRCHLAAGILSAVERTFGQIAAGSGDRVLATWRRRSNHLGDRVRITTGEEVLEGVAVDIDASGALLLKGDDGALRTIVSGSLVIAGLAAST